MSFIYIIRTFTCPACAYLYLYRTLPLFTGQLPGKNKHGQQLSMDPRIVNQLGVVLFIVCRPRTLERSVGPLNDAIVMDFLFTVLLFNLQLLGDGRHIFLVVLLAGTGHSSRSIHRKIGNACTHPRWHAHRPDERRRRNRLPGVRELAARGAVDTLRWG